MRRAKYPTDLTDAQWKLIHPLLPKPKPGGRPRTVNLREILNGIFYVVRGGVQWRMLRDSSPITTTVPGFDTKIPMLRSLVTLSYSLEIQRV